MLTKQDEDYIKSVRLELDNERLKNQQYEKQMGEQSMFSQGDSSNLIQWQLDLNEELERIDHLLKGDVIRSDDSGNERWVPAENNEHKPFNEHGVQLLLNTISFYLNRNTILSNYDEDMINWKIRDLGEDISDLIFMKYKEMGMDTSEKRKLFPLIVRELIDSIHSAYLRALNGGERDSLRTARHVSQVAQSGEGLTPSPQAFKQKKFFQPSTWMH